jgi:ABC-type phosphate transport system substrate-binding protein
MLSIKPRMAVLLLVFALALPARTTGAQAVKIVVNAASETGDVTAASLARIFLKQEKKFASGTAAFPVDQAKASPTRATFSKDVLGRSTSAVEQYWLQQVFAGRDTPPPAKATDDEVVDFVKRTPGAIGYVSASAEIPSGVKAITLK